VLRRLAVAAVLAVLAYGIVVGAGLKAAETLLFIRSAPAQADVIVVLGGDGPPRAAQAAALYKAGAAPRILVTGSGDCADIRRLIAETGVPPEVIEIECASKNTWENAVLSAPFLTAMGARKAILVTSWFHSRRALACFESVLPGLEWMSAPVEPRGSVWQMMASPDGPWVMKEYVKIGWYAMRYGITV
jgi:uncharacterized SAM-binding protein YcdF (DUF218 family)